jgi:hypothetical protein
MMLLVKMEEAVRNVCCDDYCDLIVLAAEFGPKPTGCARRRII